MNLKNIDRVIEKIRDEKKYFSMVNYFATSEKHHDIEELYDPSLVVYETFDIMPIFGFHFEDREEFSICGTPACIAGWANFLWAEDGKPSYFCEEKPFLSYQDIAARFLEIDDASVSFDLFIPIGIGLEEITREMAISALTNLKKYGEPRWSDTLKT